MTHRKSTKHEDLIQLKANTQSSRNEHVLSYHVSFNEKLLDT